MKEYVSQEAVNVRDVLDNGVIVTTDGKYIVILEITPQNFANKDESEQAEIIRSYLLLIMKFKEKNFRIKIVNQAMQSDSYTQRFKEAAAIETNSSVIDMIEDHIDFVQKVSSGSAIDRRFYLMYVYDPATRPGISRNTPMSTILSEINGTINSLKSAFSSMGNPVVEFENPFYDVTTLLYNYFNKDFMFRRPLSERYKRILKDYKTVYASEGYDDVPGVDIRDLVAPRSITDKNSEYLILNGRYYTYMYMESKSYPDSISPFTWLSEIAGYGLGYDIDVYYEKQPRKQTLEGLKWRKKLTAPRASEARVDDDNYNEVIGANESVKFFQEALKGGVGSREVPQDLYQMYFLITVSAMTKRELRAKVNALEDITIKYDCDIKTCKHLQMEAFRSAAPCGWLDEKLKPIMHHNITTGAVAAGYPFISTSLSDKEGVILGMAPGADGLITYNSFDPRYSNGNLIILGTSGAGKTYTLSSYTTRQRLLGVQNFILTPDKSEEFIPICSALGGTFVRVSATSKTRINPFDIFPEDSPANNLLYEMSPEEQSWLLQKISRLKNYYKYFIPNMSESEVATMSRITEKIYNDRGITTKNSTIYKKGTNIIKQMPTYKNLLAEIEKEVEAGRLRQTFYDVFRQFVDGVYRNMNGQTNVDLDNKYIVFGLDSFRNDPNMLAPMMYIVLEFVMGKVRSDKTQAKIVSLDEGWQLLDKRSPEVANFVEQTWRTIRAYRGGGVFATQNITDFYKADAAVAEAILNNSSAQILLKMESSATDKLQEILQLNNSEIAQIKSFRKGEALLCAGRNHLPIQIISSEKERELYSTDQESLNAKLKKIMEERKI